MGHLNWKPILRKPRERSWKTLAKPKLSESKNKHWCCPHGVPVMCFMVEQCHADDTLSILNFGTEHGKRSTHLWWRVIQRTRLSPFSKYTANHHRGRGQLVINYPEISGAGKGWRGWGRRTRCDFSAPLHWENSKTGLVQATAKWQDILVVGFIIICFGNILGISFLCWAGGEEVFEPLNPVYLALFLFTAVWEGEGNTWA